MGWLLSIGIVILIVWWLAKTIGKQHEDDTYVKEIEKTKHLLS
jgi:hypothetical protein